MDFLVDGAGISSFFWDHEMVVFHISQGGGMILSYEPVHSSYTVNI